MHIVYNVATRRAASYTHSARVTLCSLSRWPRPCDGQERQPRCRVTRPNGKAATVKGSLGEGALGGHEPSSQPATPARRERSTEDGVRGSHSVLFSHRTKQRPVRWPGRRKTCRDPALAAGGREIKLAGWHALVARADASWFIYFGRSFRAPGWLSRGTRGTRPVIFLAGSPFISVPFCVILPSPVYGASATPVHRPARESCWRNTHRLGRGLGPASGSQRPNEKLFAAGLGASSRQGWNGAASVSVVSFWSLS